MYNGIDVFTFGDASVGIEESLLIIPSTTRRQSVIAVRHLWEQCVRPVSDFLPSASNP